MPCLAPTLFFLWYPLLRDAYPALVFHDTLSRRMTWDPQQVPVKQTYPFSAAYCDFTLHGLSAPDVEHEHPPELHTISTMPVLHPVLSVSATMFLTGRRYNARTYERMGDDVPEVANGGAQPAYEPGAPSITCPRKVAVIGAGVTGLGEVVFR